MTISNLEIARIAVTALGIDLEDSLEWLSRNRVDETEEISGYEIGSLLVKMDDEIFDHNNPYLGLSEKEIEELEEMEEMEG